MRKVLTFLSFAGICLSVPALTNDAGKVTVPVGDGAVTLDWYGDGIVLSLIHI